MSRVFKVREHIRNIHLGAKGFVLLRTSRKYKIFNKKIKERIMLAITEVNGCSMCSYVHTKVALSSGMDAKCIQGILGGDTSMIPVEDAVAVLFGQDYAASKDKPSLESLQRIKEEYGQDKADLIVAACQMITMTNGMGTSMEYLWNRIRFKRNKESNLLVEVFNPLFTMLLFPPIVVLNYIKTWVTKDSRKQKYNSKKVHA
jgi:AhpD family alkylhydroperoxidase